MTSNPLNPSNGDDDNPKDPLAEMLQNLMGGKGMGDIDPAELAKAAGLPDDPNLLAQMFSQVQAMMSAPSEGPVNWQLAHDNARRVAASGTDPRSRRNSRAMSMRHCAWPNCGLTRSRTSPRQA